MGLITDLKGRAGTRKSREKVYIVGNKRKMQKYAQKEFRVPIKVEGVKQNQFTGQEIVLVSTKTYPKRWHMTWLGQEANADFGTDELKAKKEFKQWR